MLEQFNLKGKTAIVTGGGSGIGRAISMALAREGANVVVAEIKEEFGQKVAEEIRSQNGSAVVIRTDATSPESVEAMVRNTLKQFGTIDILVNNVGAATGPAIPFAELTNEQWRQGLSIDLDANFYCSRAVIGQMVKQKKGKIISISSISGMVGAMGQLMRVTYAVGKAGIIELTRILATAYASDGINVNCIAPGPILTRPDLKTAAWARFIPAGRLGQPEEVAGLVVFLASESSNYITGQTFIIDGGTIADRFAPTGYAPVISSD